MNFTPLYAIWEITSACNMNCRHCLAGGARQSKEELTTDEALKLCDDFAELNIEFVAISGGEPFLRRDWALLVKRLIQNGIVVSLITNGWLLNEQLIDKAVDSGLKTIGISLDGMEKIHDSIRKKGSFARVIRALEIMQKQNFSSSIITTVMRENIHQLPDLKNLLQDKGVKQWQLQMGIPMGSFKNESKNTILPEQITDIIDFAYKILKEDNIKPLLATSLGHCTQKSFKISEAANKQEGAVWAGCQAGKSSFGILSNGDVVGCFSLRDRQFIEGNIRGFSIRKIWENPTAFPWNRDLELQSLTGFCRNCTYAERCKAGCNALKYFTTGSLTENNYCAYKVSIEQLIPKIECIENIQTLKARIEKSMDLGLYEVADICLKRLADISSETDVYFLDKSGEVYFQLKDYKQSLVLTQQALNLSPDNSVLLDRQEQCLGSVDI
jgi:radical SAM protein with 4Fe4S-binding SPASM domain